MSVETLKQRPLTENVFIALPYSSKMYLTIYSPTVLQMMFLPINMFECAVV